MVTKLNPISTRDATGVLFIVFRIIGVDNLNRTWPYVIYSFNFNFFACAFQCFGFAASYVMSSKDMTTSQFITSLQVAINIFAIMPKMLIVYHYVPSLRETGLVFDKLDSKIEGQEERRVTQRMVKICRRIPVFCMALYSSYTVITSISSVLAGHPPNSIYIPYLNWKDSTSKMMMASFIEFCVVNASCIQNVGLDTYPVIFIYIAQVHVRILCIKILKLGKDPSKSLYENTEMLRECIDTHRTILSFIDMVRPIISKTIFIQLVVTSALIGMSLVNLVMFADFSSSVATLIYMASITLETFPLCYIANALMAEISNLPTSLFHSGWFEQSKDFRRMVPFFMQNVQRFDKIMAEKILPIEVSTFLGIGKLAFSIYALVSKMVDRKTAYGEKE